MRPGAAYPGECVQHVDLGHRRDHPDHPDHPDHLKKIHTRPRGRFRRGTSAMINLSSPLRDRGGWGRTVAGSRRAANDHRGDGVGSSQRKSTHRPERTAVWNPWRDPHKHGRPMIGSNACPTGAQTLLAKAVSGGFGMPVDNVSKSLENWSGRWDSNPRPQPWQGCALPLSYARAPSPPAAEAGLLCGFPAERKTPCRPGAQPRLARRHISWLVPALRGNIYI